MNFAHKLLLANRQVWTFVKLLEMVHQLKTQLSQMVQFGLVDFGLLDTGKFTGLLMHPVA